MQRSDEPSILMLSDSVIKDVLVPYLLVHELATAINLSRTSKKFNQIFKEFIKLNPVFILLQLLNNASRLNASGTYKTIKKINKIIKEKPVLMFQSHKVKMICDHQIRFVSPIQFVYHTADQFLQSIFKHRADKIERADEFNEHAKSAFDKVLENIKPQLTVFDHLIKLAKLDITQEAYDAFYNNMTPEERDAFENELDDHIRTKIGAAQASLPRWVLDVFFNCYEVLTVDHHAAAQTSYVVIEDDENGVENELNIERSLVSSTHQLGKHFAFFREGDKIRAQKADIPIEILIEQADQLEAIYKNRIASQKEAFSFG